MPGLCLFGGKISPKYSDKLNILFYDNKQKMNKIMKINVACVVYIPFLVSTALLFVFSY